MQAIKIEVQNVYGVVRVYPKNFQSELQDLTGQKTLNARHLQALKKLGFEVVQVCPDLAGV